jgi:peptidoglycan/LPS O-acetylase OafA/YrhL
MEGPDMILTMISGTAAMGYWVVVLDNSVRWWFRAVIVLLGLVPFALVINHFSDDGFLRHLSGTALSIPALIPGYALYIFRRKDSGAGREPRGKFRIPVKGWRSVAGFSVVLIIGSAIAYRLGHESWWTNLALVVGFMGSMLAFFKLPLPK